MEAAMRMPFWNRVSSLILAGALALASGGVAAEPAPPPAKPAELPRGTLVERVPCAGQADQAYALYLPSSYTPDRRWPILYAFDARGDGKRVAELFRTAAETHGWIVVSSWNTASDGPMEPNFTAMHALWADTHARFAIDDSRVYAAGFSGTVRFACILALTAPGTIAGVIGAGAGFPFGTPPKKDNPFAFFGTVGDRDFNYYEMNDLDAAMGALGLPHRIEHFSGPHDWPPVGLASQAVAWMELQAMKTGKREKNAALVEAEWARDRDRARAAAHPADTLHTWSAMAADYAGLRDVSEAQREAAALAASPACQQELRDRAARDRRDKDLLGRAPGILARSNPGNGPVTPAQIAAELKIPELKARAASADLEESLSAKRILNTYLGQTAFYLPQSYLEKKEYDRAVFMLSITAEIRPEDPGPWVEIASIYARKGKAGHKKALEALRAAVDKGLANPAELDREPFADLRQDEAFQRIRAEVSRRHGAS
jgi:poly(3-hydroxybutyrate) depolymerase